MRERRNGLLIPFPKVHYRRCSTTDIAYSRYGAPREDDSTTALDMLRFWAITCYTFHPGCWNSISGHQIDHFSNLDKEGYKGDYWLPTRVLDLDGDSINLVEAPDEWARYVALSHCWGLSEGYHPLKTTYSTLEAHRNGISLDSMPKTFRDAIKISRHLGVRYLWIDSLCIVQDDQDDWLRESEVMGRIYEQAWLTIAAAGARDSTAGCFLSKRQDIDPIKVQSKGRNNLPVTLFFAAVPCQDYNPAYTPLRTRAWASQEWYLSRRIIFCTQGGFSWKCKETQFNERRVFYDMHERPEWEWLLQKYSNTNLTYEKDRLIALKGVANLMLQRLPGYYRFGIWSHMPELLFWMRMEHGWTVEELGSIPSWSWASRVGAKLFWKTMVPIFGKHFDVTKLRGRAGDINLNEDGRLTVNAPVLKARTSLIPSGWARAGKYFPNSFHLSPESTLLHYTNQGGLQAHFIHFTESGDSVAVGIACLDEERKDGLDSVHVIFLLSNRRFELDPLNIDRILGESRENVQLSDEELKTRRQENYKLNVNLATNFILIKKEEGLIGPPEQLLFHKDEISPSSTHENWFATAASLGKEVRRRAEMIVTEAGAGHLPQPDELVKYDGMGRYCHWVLLAEAVDGRPNHYRRVGMGIVGCNKMPGVKLHHRDICIV